MEIALPVMMDKCGVLERNMPRMSSPQTPCHGVSTSAGKYILTGNLTTAVFADDCRFEDPNNAVSGLARYRQALSVLFDPEERRVATCGAEVFVLGSWFSVE